MLNIDSEKHRKGQDLYTMESGRVRERTVEAIRFIPILVENGIKMFVVTMLSVGMSRKAVREKLNEIIDEEMRQVDAARRRADRRFEEKVSRIKN